MKYNVIQKEIATANYSDESIKIEYTEQLFKDLNNKVRFKRKLEEVANLKQIKRNAKYYNQLNTLVVSTLENKENFYSKKYTLDDIDYRYFRNKIQKIKNNDFNKDIPLNALKINWYQNTVIEYEMLKKYLKINLIENANKKDIKLMEEYVKITVKKIPNPNIKFSCRYKGDN